MKDEHITSRGVKKARSLHRVPPEESFVGSELKKVQGVPWNGMTETLRATIVTGSSSFWTSTCVPDDQSRSEVRSDARLQWLRPHTEGC